MIALHTPRLCLKPVMPDEAAHIAACITPKISQWTALIPWPYQQSDAESWIATSAPERRLGIYPLEGGALMGVVSMPLQDTDEIGFWVGEAHEGKGYATEAARAVIGYAFAGGLVGEVRSSAHVDNVGSRRVHEKLGFSEVAVSDHFWPNRNAYAPVVTYLLSKVYWRA